MTAFKHPLVADTPKSDILSDCSSEPQDSPLLQTSFNGGSLH